MKLNKENTIEIQKVDNGYIVKMVYCERETENGTRICQEEVKVFSETDNETQNMIDMFHQVAEYLGVSYDKYSKNNLNIDFNLKGHNVEE